MLRHAHSLCLRCSFAHSFVEKGVMHILMEYATGGTLDKRIVMRDGEYIDEDQVWEWFVQIVMALRYVHTWYVPLPHRLWPCAWQRAVAHRVCHVSSSQQRASPGSEDAKPAVRRRDRKL